MVSSDVSASAIPTEGSPAQGSPFRRNRSVKYSNWSSSRRKGVKILVEGLSRVHLQNMSREASYFKADVREINEHQERTVLSETLVQSIGTLFQDFPLSGETFSGRDGEELSIRLTIRAASPT